MLTSTKNETLLKDVVAAAKAGDKATARVLLAEVVETQANSEQLWLWRAALAEDREDAMRYLEQVLQINPNNQQALSCLAAYRIAAPRRPTPAATPVAKAPLASAPVSVTSTADSLSWACPLCEQRAARKVDQCPKCGGILVLNDLRALAQNRHANETLLQQAVDKFRERAAHENSFEAHYHLALLFLNLKRSNDALTHLKLASSLRPDEPRLRAHVDALQTRKRILVVDDSATVRRIVNLTLERECYRVITAEDGMEALARLNEQSPDLILLDITMPKMNGYDVCKVIKKNPFTRDIPVLMLSGNDGFFDKVKGRMAGATDYLTKPFEPAVLLKALEKYFVKKH